MINHYHQIVTLEGNRDNMKGWPRPDTNLKTLSNNCYSECLTVLKKLQQKWDPAFRDQRLDDHYQRKTRPWPHREMQK